MFRPGRDHGNVARHLPCQGDGTVFEAAPGPSVRLYRLGGTAARADPRQRGARRIDGRHRDRVRPAIIVAQGGHHPRTHRPARLCAWSRPHPVGHGNLSGLPAVARQENPPDLSQVGWRQMPALLFLLHRRGTGSVLPPGPDLGAVPSPVLLQWPQRPGGRAPPAQHRLHHGGQCLGRDCRHRDGAAPGR